MLAPTPKHLLVVQHCQCSLAVILAKQAVVLLVRIGSQLAEQIAAAEEAADLAETVQAERPSSSTNQIVLVDDIPGPGSAVRGSAELAAFVRHCCCYLGNPAAVEQSPAIAERSLAAAERSPAGHLAVPAADIAVGLLANTWHSAVVSTRSASAFASALGRSPQQAFQRIAAAIEFVALAWAAAEAWAAGAAIAAAVVDIAGHLGPSASHGGRAVAGPCRLKR